MPKSFENKKALKFVITLGNKTFDDKGNNQITLIGYRASADIQLAGGIQMGTLKARIFGVRESDMNAITSYAWNTATVQQNLVVVYAVDGLQESLVFAGNIVTAWGDYSGAPDVFLHIQAQAARVNLLKAVPPRSYKGAIDVASVMGQIAASMGYTFESNGVDVKLVDVYLANSGMEQAKELAKAAGIDLYVDGQILAITPPGVPRKSTVPLISAATGLVGYPTYDGISVSCQILYNPAVIPGGGIKIETDIKRAAGYWKVLSMSHRLESEKPGGAWFSTLRAVLTDYYVNR